MICFTITLKVVTSIINLFCGPCYKTKRWQSSTDEKILKEACAVTLQRHVRRSTSSFIEDRMIIHAVERYDPETVELVKYLDSLRNVMWLFAYKCIFSEWYYTVVTRNSLVLYSRKCFILYNWFVQWYCIHGMYVYNLIVLSCYFSDFVILY